MDSGRVWFSQQVEAGEIGESFGYMVGVQGRNERIQTKKQGQECESK